MTSAQHCKRKKKGQESTAPSKKQKKPDGKSSPLLSAYLNLTRTLVLSSKNQKNCSDRSGEKDVEAALRLLSKAFGHEVAAGGIESGRIAAGSLSNIGAIDSIVFLVEAYLEDRSENRVIVGLGIGFLLQVLNFHRKSGSSFVQLDGVKVILSALASWPDSKYITSNGVGVLANIGSSVSLRDSVSTNRCMDAVTKVMTAYPHDTDVQTNGCSYLKYVATLPGKRNALIKRGSFRLLGMAMDTCQHSHPRAKESAFGAITMLMKAP